jgi:hypothetical protein
VPHSSDEKSTHPFPRQVIGERTWERFDAVIKRRYEAWRTKQPVWRGCDYCNRSMWKGYPRGQGPVYTYKGNGPYPLVCELNTTANLDAMLNDLSARHSPPFHRLMHAVHLMYGIEPCSELCRAPVTPRKYTGSELGMSKIERVKAAYRIEDVAGTLTSLRGGRVLKGKCPLHGELRGEAFAVFVDDQRWRCFGVCGVGGDVIDFFEECDRRGIWPTVNPMTGPS